jgi:hypothetical protein
MVHARDDSYVMKTAMSSHDARYDSLTTPWGGLFLAPRRLSYHMFLRATDVNFVYLIFCADTSLFQARATWPRQRRDWDFNRHSQLRQRPIASDIFAGLLRISRGGMISSFAKSYMDGDACGGEDVVVQLFPTVHSWVFGRRLRDAPTVLH